jgi:methylthioribose-1-phosphate isomerase
MKPPHIAYEPGVLRIIDQTKLPASVEVIELRSPEDVARAIKTMQVRGAPALGVTGAYGMAIGALAAAPRSHDGAALVKTLAEQGRSLAATRPTAVNLSWAVERMLAEAKRRSDSGETPAQIAAALQSAAAALHQEDIERCRKIGEAGAALLADRPNTVLTHCNTGDFATGGYGTGLGIVRSAWRAGKIKRVLVGETRPVLQGARLTMFELAQDGIPATLIADSMAAHFMARGEVDAVIVGADRIAANGDVANKIGTYALAVAARAHSIPFIVAAPCSSFDLNVKSGSDIVIEERDPGEITTLAGHAIAPSGAQAANPAFDITPGAYVTQIVTEAGVLRQPFERSFAALHAPRPMTAARRS